jgi:antitoxin HicB
LTHRLRTESSSWKNRKNASVGYQVSVPLLPGVITYGGTLEEARAMARDAIRCHLEGLRKDGEPIPTKKAPEKKNCASRCLLRLSPRLPVLKPKEVLRVLLKGGFEVHH